jgi:hypothetical protein
MKQLFSPPSLLPLANTFLKALPKGVDTQRIFIFLLSNAAKGLQIASYLMTEIN